MKKFDSLSQIREEIDKLDDELVELIAKRSHLLRQVASFKNTIDEVKAQDRIDFILHRVRQLAIAKEISPNLVSELFEFMIDRMSEVEIEEFRNRNAF
ncbi:MAG: chorismate mutase [Sulfurimonas sp.]|jgi:isochorismate pyruvate lyase|nr:chorismate mutase [Sulfurimonadaceae bacterium]